MGRRLVANTSPGATGPLVCRTSGGGPAEANEAARSWRRCHGRRLQRRRGAVGRTHRENRSAAAGNQDEDGEGAGRNAEHPRQRTSFCELGTLVAPLRKRSPPTFSA